MEKKVDRRADCKFSLTWETGDKRQLKRNQAVKLFMLHNKPNLIKQEILRDRIYMLIHLGTDKCTRRSRKKTQIKNSICGSDTGMQLASMFQWMCTRVQCMHARPSRNITELTSSFTFDPRLNTKTERSNVQRWQQADCSLLLELLPF